MSEERVEVIVVETRKEETAKIRTGFFGRLIEWAARTFGIIEREETNMERSLRLQVASLKAKISDLEFELQKSQQKQVVDKVAIDGLSEACVYHETRWRSQAKIEATRAGMIAPPNQ